MALMLDLYQADLGRILKDLYEQQQVGIDRICGPVHCHQILWHKMNRISGNRINLLSQGGDAPAQLVAGVRQANLLPLLLRRLLDLRARPITARNSHNTII